MDARKAMLRYFEYSLSDFFAEQDEFVIRIKDSEFGLEHIHLDLKEDNIHIQADLDFFNIFPWPVTTLSPGVMGWYAFIPFMECYHGVLSFNHHINGYIKINGQKIGLSGGKGYLEKDWGTSMPSSWIWMQTNHFQEEEVSLFGSIANIPWLHKEFTGFIFGLLYRGKLYKFTTYNQSKISDIMVEENFVKLSLENKTYRISIEANKKPGIDLPAPQMGEMISKVNESLDSKINIEFVKKSEPSEIIFKGLGRNAGLEIRGNIEELINDFK
jgi:hypothetical protein